MAVKCPKCHLENPDTVKFCGECGTQLIPLSRDIQPEVTETLQAPIKELTTGSTFSGRYQVIEVLGKGGMGKVYRVLDKKLKEEVGLKLIKPEIASDKETIERFSNELRLARKISHRNVGRMYELMEGEGTHFITMEYVPGENLKSMIRMSGQLGIGTTINIARQVCDGLAEAHRLGVVHRDLKPSNIMIDKEGTARIMDFGIARSLEAKGITGAGVMIGTPEYMSPEQVEGKETDQRSDIYSLGVILYEMVTGRVPFEGNTPLSVAVKHKTEAPPDPIQINTQIPEALSHLILSCLEKDKEKRYQSAGEVHSGLINVEKGITTTEKVLPKRKPITSKEIAVTFGLKKLFIPALAVVVLVIAALIIIQILPKEKTAPIPSDKPSIAVLPFEDLSPQKDQTYLCDGMTDELIAKLSKLKEWKVMNRTSVMQYKSTYKDIKEIGQELNVATILLGSVRREKDDIRVTAQLVSAEDRFQIWSDTYEQKLEHVFIIQSDIAEKIVNALEMELSPEAKEQFQKKPTENIEAYNLYLQGRYFWNKRSEEGLEKAIEYFEHAIKIDPNYALAYAGLADSYTTLPWYSNLPPEASYLKAKEVAQKAIEIDNTLAEAHVSLAMVEIYDRDWKGAEKKFKRAMELSPGYATAHHWYGQYLRYMGRHDDALIEYKRALELDPLSLVINQNFGQGLLYAGQYDKAIEITQKTLEMDPNFSELHGILGIAYLQKSMYEEALVEFRKERELVKGSYPWAEAAIGIIDAAMQKRDKAQEICNDLIERSEEEYISPYCIACLYFALGENDQGFQWLENAYKENDVRLFNLKGDPFLYGARSDPRFRMLLGKMGLE